MKKKRDRRRPEPRPTRDPRYLVAEVLDHLQELASLVEHCEGDATLAATDAILDGITEALARGDLTWLRPVAAKARRYADASAQQAGWHPVRTQGDEGQLLMRMARQGVQLACHHIDCPPDRAATLVEAFVHSALARCSAAWRVIPPESGNHQTRGISPGARTRARTAVEQVLTEDQTRTTWESSKTAERMVNVYLRAIGVSAHDVGNILR